MNFQFSRPLAANVANPAKDGLQPGFAPVRSDANPAKRSDPMDDQIHCIECAKLSAAGVCRAAGPTGQRVVAARGYTPVQDLPRRCVGFTPCGGNPDQRRGIERWAGLDAPNGSNSGATSTATRPSAAARHANLHVFAWDEAAARSAPPHATCLSSPPAPARELNPADALPAADELSSPPQLPLTTHQWRIHK